MTEQEQEHENEQGLDQELEQEDEQITPSPSFSDQKVGLVIFGILQILFGGFCVLMSAILTMSMIATSSFLMDAPSLANNPNGPISPEMMIPGLLFYMLLAAWFISMGIGSILTKRWARALVLTVSWIWLIGGLGAMISMLLFMPGMFDQMAKTGQMPQGIATIIKYVMLGFMTVFYLIVPGVLVLFYRGKNVKATCEFRDPQACWTDKCPLPVLALSLMFGYMSFAMVFLGFYGWVVPFFGSIASGITGAVIALVSMVLSAYVSWGTYKLRIKAWWCSILITIAWAISASITFSRVSLLDFYEKMNFPEQQMEMMRQIGMPQGPAMALITGLWVIVFLGYVLYTKKYFEPLSDDVVSD